MSRTIIFSSPLDEKNIINAPEVRKNAALPSCQSSAMKFYTSGA
jgi:hypothetical protein